MMKLSALALFALVAAAPAHAASPLPWPKGGVCPSGYGESGGYCAPMSRDAPAAIPKGDRPCPSGYFQSGNFCEEMR